MPAWLKCRVQKNRDLLRFVALAIEDHREEVLPDFVPKALSLLLIV